MQPPKTSLRPPSTVDTLARIEAKLDRLERMLGPLSALADAPAVAGTALETVDDLARGREPDLDARLRSAVGLLERISRPQTLAMLHRTVDIAESVPGLLATAADAVDDIADPASTDLHGRIEAAIALLRRMTDPDTLRVLQGLLDQLSLRDARASERRVGVFGLLKALRDPNTQRAVGFAVSVLEGFGQVLDRDPAPKQLHS